ncbi:hypothetical protein HanOQP8_Chr02g0079241 [Helianthus annuus]|nr:hypothetical protein HanOQP8_Chr02g0079241 [Helianthus annuus]
MTLRNVNAIIPAEDIALPSVKTVDCFSRLKTIEFKKLDNSELWVLRMMLTRPDRKARPVVREKSEDAALWRIFDPTFKGMVELLPCAEGEGFNLDIVDNFRVPKREALNAPLPQGKCIIHNPLTFFVKKFSCLFDDLNTCILGALGKFEANGAPKKHA